MAVAEFDLIRRYFAERTPRNAAVRLGIGDDCALLAGEAGWEWAITVDTLVEGIHFLPDCHPADLGHKCLAVNLSDLAAMGAEPAMVTLALTLPRSEEAWLEAFAGGFFALAGRYGLELAGGDTTHGPLTVVAVQAIGRVPAGRALRRSGARPGDGIYLTGSLGDAGLGLKIAGGQWPVTCATALQCLHRPEPRLAAGLALRGLAHACIDVSDGLAADLGHILQASRVGAELDWERLPLSAAIADYLAASGDWRFPLGCGDDYELCFTAPGDPQSVAAHVAEAAGCACSYIGRIQSEPGLRLRRQGQLEPLAGLGYQHF